MKPAALMAGLALALFAALAIAPAPAEAQQRERQVEILPAQGILEITPQIRQRFGLFPEFEGFRRARLFLGEPGPVVLELEGERDGQVVRERRELTESDLEALRESLVEQLGLATTRQVFTQEGRGRLVLGQTFLGLGYHGWAVPVALDVDSSQGAVAAYLLTAGAHFYLPYRLTRDRTVTRAHQEFTNYQGSRGILAGLLIGNALQGDADEFGGGNRGRGTVAGGVVGGTLGSVAGFTAVDRWAPTQGTADLWGHMGDAGFASGAALAYIAGPYDSEEVERTANGFGYTESRTRNRQAGHLMTVAGHGAGLAAGAWLGTHRDYTSGNVSALRSATLLGAQTGITLTRIAGVEENRALLSGALAGGLLGIAGGDRLLLPVALDSGEGLLINAAHLAGAALALGTTYLIVDDFDDREVLYLSTSTLGSLLGAGLVWRAVSDDARGRSASASGTGGSRISGAGSTRVEVHPGALLQGWLHSGPERPIPTLLTVRF
ncbi:MAG: hypothetical protein EA351_07195 [Gemmatimonadales bacterium]|nr:MAG: hypothetical protein EA351_07195 [Gemmatimonadales bacterium]